MITGATEEAMPFLLGHVSKGIPPTFAANPIFGVDAPNLLVSFKSVGMAPLSYTAPPVPAMAIFLKGISIGLRAGG